MSNPSTSAVTAAVIEHRARGYGSAGPNVSQKTKVDVTISGAPDAAKGANGDYSLHEQPLHSQSIRYYQGIKDDGFHMFIIYSEKNSEWQITSNTRTPSETKVGVVAYIACDPQHARTTYLESVSGKHDWFIKSSDSSKPDYKDPNMVADVKSGGESTATASESSPATSSPVAVSASPVAAPLSVPKIQTLEEMKKVLANIDKEYGVVSTEYAKLSSESSELDWTNFQTKILTPANSKLVEASSQLEAYKKPKGVDTTSLLAPEVDKSQGSESVKKQYETLLSILKNIPDMKQSCKDNNTFIPISIFLVLAKKAIDNSELLKDIIDTSLLDSKYFLEEHDADAPADAVTMNLFITGIIVNSLLQKLLRDNIDKTQAAVTEAQAPEQHQMADAFTFMNPSVGGGKSNKDMKIQNKDMKIQCKLYQIVLDTISSFPLDDKSPESLRDILHKIIEYMSTENFKKVLTEKWYKATESGSGYEEGGSSSSKSKKNKKSYKSHKSYHPKIGKTRKHHNTHNKPKRVSFVHQA